MVSSNSRSKSSARRQRKKYNNCLIWLRRFILTVILAAIVAIVATIIYANVTKPENQVSSRITSLASNYYENVFYENLINSDKYPGDPEQALSKYTDYGLSPITLRQLLLEDQTKTADDADYLLKFCDENRTSVKFYPTSPYSRTDYRAEYTYSCEYK